MSEHRARKRFGQNFLVQPNIINAIVQAVNPTAGDTVIEIGPGLGALTLPLLAAAGQLHVIEIDRDLAAKLRQRNAAGLHVHEMDVLQTDITQLTGANTQLRVVGNLPYNISTPLLLKLAASHAALLDLHVMLQKEVVDRMTARSGTRAFGRLSVIMQSVFNIRSDALAVDALDALSNTTRIAFSNKRKTLRNNFKHVLSSEQLQKLDIDPSARAETLSLDAFHRLANAIVRPPP